MEYLDTPGLAAELQEIHGMYLAEIKEKKKLEKGLEGQADDFDDEEEDEEADPADDPSTGFEHMMIGDTPTLPFKNAASAKMDEAKKLSEKLLAFKKVAQRKVTCLEFHSHSTCFIQTCFTKKSKPCESAITTELDLGCHHCEAHRGATNGE